MKGKLTYRELNRHATHLRKLTLKGAPYLVTEQQVLEAFLRALPPAQRREVLKVDRTTLRETCEEAERQETLLEAEAVEGMCCNRNAGEASFMLI